MAAEHVFYGENSTGVGGDVAGATTAAAWMVGMCGMAPERIDFNGRFQLKAEEERARRQIQKRLQDLGGQIMNRAQGGAMTGDALGMVLGDPQKRALAAQFLGMAYVIGFNFIRANREAVEHVAETLMERREMHGDEVVELLDSVQLVAPEIDWTEERTYPRL
jgi:ATP-dependent Zn protease